MTGRTAGPRKAGGALPLGACVLVALILPGVAPAQIPGDELPVMGRIRNEYLATTYTDIKQVLADWTEHHRQSDFRRLVRQFTEDGLYSPVEGWYVQGRESLTDTLTTRLTHVRNYYTSLLDFTASGGLVYYMGRMSYRLEGPVPADVRGTFVMVLYQQGRNWRIRSYVERAGIY